MTDEERARLAVDKMPGLTKAQRADWVDALVSLATAIRAEEREQIKRRLSEKAEATGLLSVECIAAAIRAMGDKGNG